MANLTGTLNTETRGKSVAAGEEVASNGLLQAAGNLLQDWNSGAGSRASTKAASAAAKDKAADDAALDQAEGAMFSEMKRAESELGKAKAGVAQGRLPPGALQVNVTAVKDRLFAAYPEQRAEIGKYLQERGYDHWEFRDLAAAKKVQEGQQDSQLKAQQSDYEYAFTKSVGDPGLSFEQNASLGAAMRAQDNVFERAKERSALTAQMTDTQQKAFTFQKEQTDLEVDQSVNAVISEMTNSYIPTLHTLIAAGVGDADKEDRLAKVPPLIANVIESQRQATIQSLGAGATKARLASINERFDGLKKQVEDQFSGTMSSYQTNKRAADNISNTFGVSIAQAMPAYTMLSQAMGKDAVNALFQGDLSTVLPKETTDKIRAEILGLKTEDAAEGRVRIARIVGLMKGELSLKDMSEREAQESMPLLARTLQASQASVLTGDAGAIKPWSNSYGNLIEAVVEVQPGQKNLAPLWAGSRLVFSRGARTAQEKMLADPSQKEYGQALILGSRGAAAQAMSVANSTPSRSTFVNLKWNGTKYVPEFDKAAYAKFVKANTTETNAAGRISSDRLGGPDESMGSTVQTISEAEARKVPAGLQDRASILNASIEHLVQTAKYDESVPAGATPKQLYDHYALGKPLVSAGGKPMLSGDEEYSRSVQAFEDKLRTVGVEGAAKPKPTDPIRPVKFSSDEDAAVRTMLLEASNQGEAGLAAVASTLLNRQDSGTYGSTMSEVVLSNNGRTWQFEPWKTRAREGIEIDPKSEKYQEALRIYQAVKSGQIPRQGFNNFLNKDIVTSRGDPIPSWASGAGTKIGDHTFF